MAVIGDVLVKLALNAAEFTQGIDQANSKLDEQGKKLEAHGESLDGIAKQLAGLAQSNSVEQFAAKLSGLAESFSRMLPTVVGVGAAVGVVLAYMKELQAVEDYAKAVDKVRQQYALTTDQAKGLEAAARQTGMSVDDLNKALSPQAKTFLGDYYKAMFGDTGPKIDEIAKQATKLDDVWKDLGETVKNIAVDAFGDSLIRILSTATDAVAGLTKGIRDYYAYIKSESSKTASPGNALVPGTGGLVARDPNQDDVAQALADHRAQMRQKEINDDVAAIQKYNQQIADAQDQLAQGLDRGGMIQADIDNLTKKVAQLTARIKELGGAAGTMLTGLGGALGGLSAGVGLPGAQGAVPGFQGAGPNILLPPALPTDAEINRMAADNARKALAASTGGGGKSDDDYIKAQIDRYNALQKAAENAYSTISKYQGDNIEELNRQVTVQRQIDDIVGKLGAKWADAHPQIMATLRDAVTGAEEWRSKQDELMKSTQSAIDTQRKYGDGTAALDKVQTDLNKQLATGKLQSDAYGRALKEQTENVQQAALAARRYDDDLGSLAAGFEHAANAYARSNDLYSTGEQSFNALTTAMGDGLDALEGKSNKTFGQIASDFANMLAKMALQAATSAVFKAVFGAISGSFTPEFATPAGYADYSGGSMLDYFNRPHALGGPVDAGQSYLVGENGPERFVPAVAGSISPMGRDTGGVTVNLDMKQSQGAPNPTAAMEFGRRVKQAVVDVIAQEKRPGGTLYARHNA